MEMDSLQLDNNMELTEDESSEHLLSASSSHVEDVFGEQQILPRVGNEFQAEIPPLISGHDQFQLANKPVDTIRKDDGSNTVLLGLSVPIMWVDSDVSDENRTLDYGNSESSQIALVPEAKTLDTKLKNKETKPKCPLPGSSDESWSNIEQQSFILGLYIFGKNLILLKRFIECKEMGDILSYYYGKFYRSDGHRRWSDCRKMRSRKCILGQRIFTGWRQQELLSRLFAHISDECQKVLIEVSRSFGEGKISLEEYVSHLKNTVGIATLIEAVGVGRGKKDLTGIATDPVKTTPVFTLRPEIPIGKACSSLSPQEIIKFLNGDFRLSKARSSDLFWEAVWPRLLARGWHSEQPKDQGFPNSKHSLVFLIPGVKKFSRRKLTKGSDYFDSVTDVLSKVASEPGLLEIENESGQHNGWDLEMKKAQNDLSNVPRRCYLQPRVPNGNRDLMKFTIVDTSLANGQEQTKVRELRSLPVDAVNISHPSRVSSETDRDSFDEDSQENKVEETNSSSNADSSECTVRMLNSGLANYLAPMLNSGLANYLAPLTKRPQITASKSNSSTVSPMGSTQNLFPLSSLAKESQEESNKEILYGTRVQSQPLIDLNLPHVEEDLETDEPLMSQSTHEAEPSKDSGSVGATTMEQPMTHNRRQSTRNRPLTAKALEALACGFLSTQRKRKSSEVARRVNSKSTRRVRDKNTGNNGDRNDTPEYKIEKGEMNGLFNSNGLAS